MKASSRNLLGAVLLLASACGGDSGSAPASSAAASAPAARASAPATASAAAPPAAAMSVADFFQGDPKSDIKGWKGWVNRTYDYGFLIPTGWTSASLPGSGFLMNDKEQKAMIALVYDGPAELTHASLVKNAKMAPFQATDLTEVTPPTIVEVGPKKFRAKAGLAKGKLNGAPGQIVWIDLAGIQTHEGERGPYHFHVMVGLKDGVSEAAKTEAMSAVRAMTPMSGEPYFKK
jgi:hypothetical protein